LGAFSTFGYGTGIKIGDTTIQDGGDGTLVLTPKTGKPCVVVGDFYPTGNYFSAGAIPGITNSYQYQDWGGGFHTLFFENGLLVGQV
jgi:hypothetical protein